jgi:5'-3' exonuclease
MNIRTLLVDGNYLMKRSQFGAKNVMTNKFGDIGILYSFYTTVRMLISKHLINKCILFFDGQNGGKLRFYISPAYKSNREDKEWHEKIELTEAEIEFEKEKKFSILKNKTRIKAYGEELFLREIECPEIEADDLIAEYCLKHNNLEELFIYSRDHDYAQLLDLNIKIINPDFPQPIDKLNYSLFFKHHYTNALTIKIICGDDSDNVAGIDGIQEPTLLKYFPELKFKTLSVRDICKKADDLNKERVANKKKPLKCFENLLNNVDRLKLNYKLMNLRQPMLNEEAIEELKQLELPLSPEDRGSKNLYKMMMEDEFLTIYKGTFVDYVQPFYTVIMNEKQLLEEYYKKDGK